MDGGEYATYNRNRVSLAFVNPIVESGDDEVSGV